MAWPKGVARTKKPASTRVVDAPKKRGRPAGSKNKSVASFPPKSNDILYRVVIRNITLEEAHALMTTFGAIGVALEKDQDSA